MIYTARFTFDNVMEFHTEITADSLEEATEVVKNLGGGNRPELKILEIKEKP